MQVNAGEIQSIIDGRLADAGLATFVDHGRQRFTEFPEGLFVELVITDAARQLDFQKVMKSVQEYLRKENIEIQVVIRPLWVIQETEYFGPARAPDGSIRAALVFSVNLSSGSEKCNAVVNVTIAAIDVIRRKLGIERLYGNFGWSPDKGDVSKQCLTQVVRSYVTAELEGGSGGYWEPLTEPVREVDEAGMKLLLGESTAFRDLRSAVHNAFVGPNSNEFVGHLKDLRIDPLNFDHILPDLANTFARPFKSGDQFLVSATDLYNRLRPAEKDLLRCYFAEVARGRQSR